MSVLELEVSQNFKNVKKLKILYFRPLKIWLNWFCSKTNFVFIKCLCILQHYGVSFEHFHNLSRMLCENKCVLCDFSQKMAFFANKKKSPMFQKVYPSFYCSPWLPLSKKLGWMVPQEMHAKTFPGPRVIHLSVFSIFQFGITKLSRLIIL